MKNDCIYLDDENRVLRCICEDDETAVFAMLRFNGNGESYLDYETLIAYCNDTDINTMGELPITYCYQNVNEAIGMIY